MIKFPKTPRFGTTSTAEWQSLSVVVSEKLDGANVGVSFTEDEQLQLQSRGHVLRGGSREKQFSPFKALCADLREALLEVLGTRYLLFGEWLYAKQKVFYDALPGYFITYDLYDKQTGDFLTTDVRQGRLKGLFPEAPILHRSRFKKVNNFGQFIGISRFRTEHWRARLLECAQKAGVQDPLANTDDTQQMEGVYIKVEDDCKVVGRLKILRPDYEKVRGDENWARVEITNLLR